MDDAPKTPAWESAAIILAVLMLLPKAFAPGWVGGDVLMAAAGVLMVIVLIRKIVRFRHLWKKQEKKD
jgi:hypothetical protein